MGRKFSMTSSQGHFTFIKAFPLYKDRLHWRNVAKYLYGPNWKKSLNIPEDDQSSIDEIINSCSSQDDDKRQGNDEDTGEFTFILIGTYFYKQIIYSPFNYFS